jgi:predicted ArsR family transcriptional regulator
MRQVNGRQGFFESTRGQIIRYLMGEPHTVSQLAEKLDLTDNAVRAHLVALERDGVVRQEGERRSGGRPAFVYHVTPRADELFPKSYDRALTRVLDVLDTRMDDAELGELLREAGRRGVEAPDDGADPEQRLRRAVEVLEEYGGLPETETGDDGTVRIRTRSCPLSGVVREHPLCGRIPQGALETVLGVDVELRFEMDDRPSCTFVARLAEPVGA